MDLKIQNAIKLLTEYIDREPRIDRAVAEVLNILVDVAIAGKQA